MRLNRTPRNPVDHDTDTWYKQVAIQVNALSEGRLFANHSALTSNPTTGDWAKGDFVRNSAPSELGAATAKYVIFGWICVTSGTPGTWVQCRFLTGN